MEKARYYTSVITEKGSRRMNEDSFVLESISDGKNCGYIMAICDGLGGLSKGEVASGYIKQALTKWYKEEAKTFFQKTTQEVSDILMDQIQDIHKVLRLNAEKNEIMYGSTLTVIVVLNSRYVLAHVGDSRAYLYYGGSLRQLTKDQTVYQDLIDMGRKVKKEDVRKHRTTLTQCVGANSISPKLYIGILPDEYELLLCSDGFYYHQSEEELRAFFMSKDKDKLKTKTQKLLQDGEKDNITAMLLQKIYL